MSFQYDHSLIRSSCPIVRREGVGISRLEDVSGGLRIIRRVDFEVEVLWLRESEARMRVFGPHGAEISALSGETHNDYYGFLTSMTDLVDRAPVLADYYGFAPASPLRGEVVLTVTDTPVVAATDGGDSLARAVYRHIPLDWCRGSDPRADAWLSASTIEERCRLMDDFGARSPYVKAEVVCDGPVWASGMSGDENERLLRELVEAALAGVSEEVAARVRADGDRRFSRSRGLDA